MKAPTQDDVARAAGVSRTLVSRALRGSGRVSASNRARILAVAARLGYRPNEAAVSLASARSGVIGVILPNIRNPFYDAVSEGLRRAAAAASQTTVFTISGQDRGAALEQADHFMRLRATGLIMVAPNLGDAELCQLAEQTPLTLIGRAPAGGRVDSVRIDERRAAHIIMRALASRGYRKVVPVAPHWSMLDPTGHERQLALISEAEAHGFSWNQVTADGSGATLRSLVAPGTAMIVHNDILAIDVVAAVVASGLRLGSDVAVVSYDNTYLAARAEFSLTSIDQSPARLGSRAVELLLSRVADPHGPPRDELVEPRLEVRGSLH
ncbi:MAG: LacI family DNA-binding transcriptional regulator [Propionibacteriaceae bacterium]|nr:LacI family DNA-binding transcriptional regulator [Propionibacteriaceae bacterium]